MSNTNDTDPSALLAPTGTTEAELEDTIPVLSPSVPQPPPSKPALSKEEIRSLFQELSDGLGVPTARAAAPESEVTHYAAPRPGAAKSKTPIDEPPIVVRASVIDEALHAAPPPATRARPGMTLTRTLAVSILVATIAGLAVSVFLFHR
jgi:hypothetical protein